MEGAGGYSTRFYTGDSAPRSNLLPFYIPCIFHWKGTPFVYILLTNGTAGNVLYFKKWINYKTRTLSRLFQSHKMYLLAALGIFTDRNDSFSLPLVKSLLFQSLKGTLFVWRSLPLKAFVRGVYPRGDLHSKKIFHIVRLPNKYQFLDWNFHYSTNFLISPAVY